MGMGGYVGFVCDENDGAALFVEIVKNFHNFDTCFGVEVACALASVRSIAAA